MKLEANIILPTATDIVIADLVVERIMKRQLFEKLKRESKYFANINIIDVPWKYSKYMPALFKEEHPYDFKVKFSIIGCNMIKCYNPSFCGNEGLLINESHYACQESCHGVYQDVCNYMYSTFPGLKKSSPSSLLSPPPQFDTLSIRLQEDDNFCGVELSELKTIAIHPSSRWIPSTDLKLQQFIDRNKNNPIKLSEIEGLVDAPPLNWETRSQKIKFNNAYCSRFRKYYDIATNTCCEGIHRTVLKYIIGENITNNLSDNTLMSLASNNGFLAGVNTLLEHRFKVNPGYSERKILHVSTDPDIYITQASKERIEILNFPLHNEIEIISTSIANTLIDIGRDILITTVAVDLTKLTAKLLSHYSENILHRVYSQSIALGNSNLFLFRVYSMFVRMGVVKLGMQLTIKALSAISTAVSGVFAVSLITFIPDLLIGIFDIGGYKN